METQPQRLCAQGGYTARKHRAAVSLRRWRPGSQQGAQPQGPGWQRAGRGGVDASAGAGAGGGWGNFPREAGRRGDLPGARAEDGGPSFSGENQLLGLRLCDQLWEGWPGRDRERPGNRRASGEGEPSALGHLPCHRCTRHSYTPSPRGRGQSRGTLTLLPERSADGDKLPHPHPPWLRLAGTSSSVGWEGPRPSLRPLCPRPDNAVRLQQSQGLCELPQNLGAQGRGRWGF